MKLGHWPKFQKLHIISPFYTKGSKLAYFHSKGSPFRDSKLLYVGIKLGRWQKFQNCTYTLVLPPSPGVEIELIFTLRAAASEIHCDFQNCHILAWNFLVTDKRSGSCTYSPSTPGGRNWTYFLFYGQQFTRYRQFFKIAIFRAWNLAIDQSFRSCTYTVFLPQGVEIKLISLCC